MQCAGCGQSLTEGVSVCLHCGTPVPPGFSAKQVDVALLPEPVPPSGDNWSATFRAPPTSPYQHFDDHAATTPPPPPSLYTRDTPGYNADFSGLLPYGLPPYQISKPTEKARPRRLNRWLAGAVVALVCLMSLGIFAYAHAMGRTHLTSSGGLDNQPAAHCGVPAVDKTAELSLLNPHFTTGLRNIAHKDFTPVDTVDTFTVGQTAYFTYTIGSNQSATITSEWCWGNGNYTSAPLSKSVSHSAGVQGYFSLQNLDATTVGTVVLVVLWNNSVAYTHQVYVKAN